MIKHVIEQYNISTLVAHQFVLLDVLYVKVS